RADVGKYVRGSAARQLRPHSRLQSGHYRQPLLRPVCDVFGRGNEQRATGTGGRRRIVHGRAPASHPVGVRWFARHRLAQRKTPDMNNLHRELAPISDAAWAQIEEEASRTLKRYLAGRRVVDVQGPGGTALAAVGT